MDKYKVLKVLGEGTFGVVSKCINNETNEVVAVKKMKEKMNWATATNLREVKILKDLKPHPNVV
jgi:male germ cell-associated kinase